MRILMLTADYPPIEGGIASVALHLSRVLAAMGHEVTVVAPAFPEMSGFDAAEPVRVLRFRGYAWGWLRVLPMGWRAWPELRRADLVLGINASHGGLLAMAARRPYVTFAYAFEFMRFAGIPPLAALLRAVYNRARFTVAISRFTRQALEDSGVHADNIVTLFPGVTPAREAAPDALWRVRESLGLGQAPFLLAVGRFVPRKGHRLLVRALPAILEQHPALHLVMVGRGPCLPECQREIKTLGLGDRVHCPGYVDEDTLAALYQSCALFALPTGEAEAGDVEGFGLVFVEAHQYGKAVVAGRSGGVEDAVLDGQTGLVVEAEVDAVAKGILSLLNDPALAQRLGQAGWERAERECNWSAFARELLRQVEVRRG